MAAITIEPNTFFKFLGDEMRLTTLLLILSEQELCVCELMAALEEDSQPKVSRQLAQLKKAGILSDRKARQWVFYSLNPALPLWMKGMLSSTVQHRPDMLTLPLQRLAKMGDRPDRVALCCN